MKISEFLAIVCTIFELLVYAVFDVGWSDATAMWVVQFDKQKILYLGYAKANHTSITDFIRGIMLVLPYKI
jgi:hypothetical protein